MKFRKYIALLLFPLFIQPVIARNNPECPSAKQVKYIKIISSKKNHQDDWMFTSAPFQANGAAWEITFIEYLSSGSIYDAQYKWDHTEIGGPFSSNDCSYFADWETHFNWIIARPI